MKTANLIRWGALAALASGALWIAGGLLHLAYPQDPPGALGYYLNYLGTAIFSAAYLGVLGGLVGLHACQVDSYGRTDGKGGFLAGLRRRSAGVRGPSDLGDLSAKRHTCVAIQRPRLRLPGGDTPHEPGVGAPGHRHAAGRCVAPLVRVRARSLGGLLGPRGVRGFRGGRPHLVSARIRAVVGKERYGRPQRVCRITTLSEPPVSS
jgi:hypothetical protein